MKKEHLLTKKFYSENALYEWNRLVKDPFSQMELDTTLKFLKKHLPKKGLILDAGGGPGRYSIELAKLGYNVVLLDFVEENLELAKDKIREIKLQDKIKDVIPGTITDLSRFKSNSFDAVLCLGGPLSHVHPEKERKKAVSELVRVAKKGAPIFVSVMGRFGNLMRAPVGWPEEIEMTRHFEKLSLKGDDYMWHGGKGYAHFFELDELKSLFGNSVKLLESVGLEGLGSPVQEQINNIAKNPMMWKNWLKMHYATCTKPAVADCSLHFMVIGRKIK